jgi:hypothetical protein
LRRGLSVVRLGLFGSVARNETGPESDVDLVAEFAADAEIGLFKLFDLERELAGLWAGRRAFLQCRS